jgi:uncharacterized paraquat-inducible protein A
MTKCPKCGYDNPQEAKYCLNCGFKLVQEEKYNLEAEGMLLIASGTILLMTLLFNALIKILTLLLLIYFVIGITSIYSGIRLYSGSSSIFNLILATISIVFGFAGSFFLYLLGLSLKGLVSPDWIIYLIVAYKLYADRKKLRR